MSEHNPSDRAGYASASFRPPSPKGYEDVDVARRAAEALFAPKRSIADPTPNSMGSAQQNVRKPRILSAAREQLPVIEATDPEANGLLLKHETRSQRKRVPVSDFTRIRTWLKYGMTVRQVADMYGVNVSELERALQKT